jgi:hypothetical protein
MTDIFSEVEQDLRREQASRIWNRFGPYILGAAVLIVLLTAGWRGWLYWNETKSAAEGDRFVAALQLATDGKQDEALKSLDAIAKDGNGGYPVLAKFRIASELATTKKTDDAVKAFDALAADTSTPSLLRNLAQLRAAMLLVDTADLPTMKGRLETMAATGAPWRHTARELLGLTAWRVGDTAAACGYFQAIADDPETPSSMQNRVRLMQELIRAKIGDPAPKSAAKS